MQKQKQMSQRACFAPSGFLDSVYKLFSMGWSDTNKVWTPTISELMDLKEDCHRILVWAAHKGCSEENLPEVSSPPDSGACHPCWNLVDYNFKNYSGRQSRPDCWLEDTFFRLPMPSSIRIMWTPDASSAEKMMKTSGTSYYTAANSKLYDDETFLTSQKKFQGVVSTSTLLMKMWRSSCCLTVVRFYRPRMWQQ